MGKEKRRISLSLHPKQMEVYQDTHRFRVVVAGRRWGKSYLSRMEMIAHATKPNQKIWYVAPTYRMAKQIMWGDLLDALPKDWISRMNETNMMVELVNGSRIELKGADKPDSLRGVGLHGLILDEYQDMREETWTQVLRPTLADKKGWCLFIGTPKSYNVLYKAYKLGQPGGAKDWKSWQFPTLTSPFIPLAELEAAKKDMDEKSFRQEFLACHLPDTEVQLWDGGSKAIKDVEKWDELVHLQDDGRRVPCYVTAVGITGSKKIISAILETGEVIRASAHHKFKFKGEEVKFDVLNNVERNPVIWRPTTLEEHYAALVGYNTGDGSLAEKTDGYVKVNGEVSTYHRLAGAFYSNVESDLDKILQSLNYVGLATGSTVCAKKTKPGRNCGYQIQVGKYDSKKLISLGAPLGKKTAQVFDVPEWIKNGTKGIKRAYLGALFGAEGSTPTVLGACTKKGRQPCLMMTKLKGVDGMTFFKSLQNLAKDLGVEATINVNNVPSCKTHTNYVLRVVSDSILDFYENVSFVYCDEKAKLGWLFSQYIRAERCMAQSRIDTVLQGVENGETFKEIGKRLGLTYSGANALYNRIKAGHKINAGHSFPSMNEWLKARWSEERQLLRLEILDKKLSEEQEVWNITVDSSDHSYLLADGTNNFNSFESMAGRVYYPFSRAVHIKSCPFNPKLPVWVGMDFNIDPMSSVILQPQANGELWAVGEIVKIASNTEEMACAIEQKYYRWQDRITLYPDPAGGARQHARGETDIDILREHGFSRIKYRRQHPAIADRVNSVNRMLMSAEGKIRLFVDPSCTHLINALEQTLYIEGSREVDKSANIEHSADALGYAIEIEYPIRKLNVAGYSR